MILCTRWLQPYSNPWSSACHLSVYILLKIARRSFQEQTSWIGQTEAWLVVLSICDDLTKQVTCDSGLMIVMMMMMMMMMIMMCFNVLGGEMLWEKNITRLFIFGWYSCSCELDTFFPTGCLQMFVECEHLWVYQICLDMIRGLKRWYMREPPNPLFPGQDRHEFTHCLVIPSYCCWTNI